MASGPSIPAAKNSPFFTTKPLSLFTTRTRRHEDFFKAKGGYAPSQTPLKFGHGKRNIIDAKFDTKINTVVTKLLRHEVSGSRHQVSKHIGGFDIMRGDVSFLNENYQGMKQPD
jgi:hypothetical protein